MRTPPVAPVADRVHVAADLMRQHRRPACREIAEQHVAVDPLERQALRGQPAREMQQIERVGAHRPQRVVAIRQIAQTVVDQLDLPGALPDEHPTTRARLDLKSRGIRSHPATRLARRPDTPPPGPPPGPRRRLVRLQSRACHEPNLLPDGEPPSGRQPSAQTQLANWAVWLASSRAWVGRGHTCPSTDSRRPPAASPCCSDSSEAVMRQPVGRVVALRPRAIAEQVTRQRASARPPGDDGGEAVRPRSRRGIG
jgi:hypothetical protein